MNNFVNDYSDYNIDIPDSAKPNDTGNVYVSCPMCTRTKSKNKNAKSLGIKIESGYGACNHCGWNFHLLTSDYVKNNDHFDRVKTKALTDLPKGVISYFETRNISKHTLNRAKVGYKLFNKRYIKEGAPKGEIAFIYYDMQLPVLVKYRDRDKGFRIEKKTGKLILYGVDDIKKQKKIFIVEGEIDKLSYGEIDVWNCCSVPNGAQLSKNEKEHYDETGEFISENHMNLNYLDSHIKHFDNADVIYIGTDTDAPGLKLREELGRRFGKKKCKILDYSVYQRPAIVNKKEVLVSCNDANNVLKYHGKKALDEVTRNAKDFPITEVVASNDIVDKIIYQFNHGVTKGKSTGFPSLDPHFTWRFGHFIILNGYPGQGKTQFMITVTLFVAIKYKWKMSIYSPENYPVEDLYTKYIETYVGNTIDKEVKDRMTIQQLKDASSFIHEHIYLIKEPEDGNGFTPKSLRDLNERLIRERGIVMCIKDPWNALDEDRQRGDDFNSYMKRESHNEQAFATKHNVINAICIHPPTPKKGVPLEVPTPFEAEGGAWMFKRAYEFLAVHRDNVNDVGNTITNIYVQKTKHHKLVGIPTYNKAVQLTFDRRKERFLDKDSFDPIEDAKLNIEQVMLKF